jgi:hypothetical protein
MTAPAARIAGSRNPGRSTGDEWKFVSAMWCAPSQIMAGGGLNHGRFDV